MDARREREREKVKREDGSRGPRRSTRETREETRGGMAREKERSATRTRETRETRVRIHAIAKWLVRVLLSGTRTKPGERGKTPSEGERRERRGRALLVTPHRATHSTLYTFNYTSILLFKNISASQLALADHLSSSIFTSTENAFSYVNDVLLYKPPLTRKAHSKVLDVISLLVKY